MRKIVILMMMLTLSTSLFANDCTKVNNVQSFVKRFYIEVLERPSDRAGLIDWTSKLINKEKTGADVALGFVFSQEFISRNKNNSEYLTTLYKAFFNREPDTEGFNAWISELSRGVSREEVLNGFLHSQEFINLANTYGIQAYEGAPFKSEELDNFVKRFYSVVLGRNPASTEVSYWADKLSSGTSTGADIAFGFVFSAEFANRNTSNTDFLNTLYKAFFNRDPDTSGFNGWMNDLSEGMSREDLLEKFLHSQEFINLTNSYNILAYEGAPKPEVSSNTPPTANAGTDIDVFGNKPITLDGRNSSDDSGCIMEYIWTEGTTVLGTGSVLNNLTLNDGEHTITLTVKDSNDATSTDEVVVNADCTNVETMNLSQDSDGTVNYTGTNTNTSICYNIRLSSNNNLETYMLYMNLYNGTVDDVYRHSVKLYNDNGAIEHEFNDARFMYRAGHSLKEAFEISADGDYYIKVYRSRKASKFGLSVHPSLANGLVQDFEGETNDHFTMATPITLAQAMNDISGSLNMSRTQTNSLKNTDDEDFYSINLSQVGTYAFYINLFNGTHSNVSFYTKMEIYDENYALVHTFNSKIYTAGHYYSSTFDVTSSGKYYIRIARENREATKYRFSIQPSLANGLVQNSDREFNDFMSSAAPVTWAEVNTGISGSLNLTRQSADTSIKYTDSADYYAIDFTTAGAYTLDFNLISGTHSDIGKLYRIDLELKNSVGTLEKDFNSKLLYESGQNVNSTFNIPYPGIYYIYIRRSRFPVRYNFTIM